MFRGPDLLVNKRIPFNLKLKTGDEAYPKEREASAKTVRKNETKLTRQQSER